jgi:pimeloyl-ACP methyl ester carboxylesterase
MRLLVTALLAAGLCAAQPKVETGDLNGAAFRIDVPEQWDGGLIVYCHGYSPVPGKFADQKPNPMRDALLGQGFAMAQSGYVAGGWAIDEAMQDTQALLRYFRTKYGAPKETYVMGHSMGGFLTMALLERFPTSYDGGLALCGPLAAAPWFMRRHVFDMRVVFDYYFPGALPPPDKVPAGYAMTPALNEKVQALLDGKPPAAEALRRYTGIRTNKELANTLVFFTYILKDVQQRGGGNPFDNRNIIYEGTGEDDAVNDGVNRYAADPRAAEYLRAWYTPTGRLERPMLAIHTTYDPLVPPEVPNQYQTLAQQAGSADLFVQQYVKHAGHCSILPDEIARGLGELRAWKQQGQRPPAGPSR